MAVDRTAPSDFAELHAFAGPDSGAGDALVGCGFVLGGSQRLGSESCPTGTAAAVDGELFLLTGSGATAGGSGAATTRLLVALATAGRLVRAGLCERLGLLGLLGFLVLGGSAAARLRTGTAGHDITPSLSPGLLPCGSSRPALGCPRLASAGAACCAACGAPAASECALPRR